MMRALAALALASVAEAGVESSFGGFKGLRRIGRAQCIAACKAAGKGDKSWGWSYSGWPIMKVKCTCVSGYSVTGKIKFQCAKEDGKIKECCYPTCKKNAVPSVPSGGSSGGSAPQCSANKPKGWTCPKNGGCDSANGACTYEDVPGSAQGWQDWVGAHNVYRCMHDVPPVSWNEAVYQDGWKHFKPRPHTCGHSKMYDVKPPAGPTGENLYWSTPTAAIPMQAVAWWYAEIGNCGPLPGCRSGSHGVTGHFTAMIWEGVKTIGCFVNKDNLAGCRYKALDKLSCETPNFGRTSTYSHTVFPKVKSFHQCVAEVKACGLPVHEPPNLDRETGIPPKSALFGNAYNAENHQEVAKMMGMEPASLEEEDYDDQLDEESPENETVEFDYSDMGPAMPFAVQFLLASIAALFAVGAVFVATRRRTQSQPGVELLSSSE